MIRPLVRTMRRSVRKPVRFLRATAARARTKPPTVAARWRHPIGKDGGGTYRPVRVAVAGTGRIARAHLDVLASFEDVVIVGLANRGRSDPTPLAREYAVESTFDNAERMIDETQPDLVYVLVDVESVATVASQVLARGLPCLIEKPAALEAERIEELARLAAAQNVPHLVAVNRRFHSVIDHALEAIRLHGPVHGLHVEVHEPIEAIRNQGRFATHIVDRWLAANSIHMIDLVRRCLGEVVEIEVLGVRDGCVRDGFTACFATESGATGTIAGHWRSPAGNRLVLFGNGVRAELEPLDHGTIITAELRREPLAIDVVDQRFKPGFYAQSAALVDAVALGEPIASPACDLADHARTMRLVEAIEAGGGSMREGRVE